jgi:hypothetical protein
MLLFIKSKALLLAAIVIASTILFSFKPAGGEGFEIYLNNKLVMQRFGNQINNVQELQLDRPGPDDKLIVKYHHCGKVGKNRIITIRNENNEVLKEWRYADAATPVSAMSCRMNDIISLEKIKASKLKLFYTSSELPKGRLLATISFSKGSFASR